MRETSPAFPSPTAVNEHLPQSLHLVFKTIPRFLFAYYRPLRYNRFPPPIMLRARPLRSVHLHLLAQIQIKYGAFHDVSIFEETFHLSRLSGFSFAHLSLDLATTGSCCPRLTTVEHCFRFPLYPIHKCRQPLFSVCKQSYVGIVLTAPYFHFYTVYRDQT